MRIGYGLGLGYGGGRLDPAIMVDQTTSVQIVARTFEPIIVDQTTSVAIVASANAGITSPDDVAGLVLWHDMLDAGSYTQAGTVTSITNKKSSVAWTEGTAPPTYDSTGLNGHPCFKGNATNMKILSPAGDNTAIAAAMNGDHTLVIVGQAVTADVVDCWFSGGNSANASKSLRVFGRNSGGVGGQWRINNIDDAVTALTVNTTAGEADTNPRVLAFRVNRSGGVASMWVNNVLTSINASAFAYAATTITRAGWLCRADSAPDTFGDMKIGSGILYNSALDDSTIAQLSTLMGAGFGLTV